MKLLLSASLLLAWIALGSGFHLPDKPLTGKPLLLVVNQGDHNLSIIDPSTDQIVRQVDVQGITGHEVGVSPNGRLAFVPIYGNSGVGKAGTDGRMMVVVDTQSGKIVHTLDFGHGVRPHEVVADPKRRVLYVTTELDKAITIVDPMTFQVLGQIPTGQDQSHMLVVSHDGKLGYTANVGPGTVSVLDMAARKTLKIIPISGNTQRIAISVDDKNVFTADQTKPQLAVIDTGTRSVKTWIPLPSIGYGTAATGDGRWLLVALRTAGKVAVVNLGTLKVDRILETGGIPTEIMIRPDGKVAYVSCGKKVAAVDLDHWTVDTTLESGEGADGLGWANQSSN